MILGKMWKFLKIICGVKLGFRRGRKEGKEDPFFAGVPLGDLGVF